MKTVSYLLLVFIGVISSSFYRNDKRISIYLEEYEYSFTPQKIGCIDTLLDKLEDGRHLKIFLFECMGKMHIECYKDNRKIEEGDYINSLDLLKKYSYGVNGITGKKRIKVREYYQPLRSGDWLFYDSKGRLLYKKVYVEGVLQNKK